MKAIKRVLSSISKTIVVNPVDANISKVLDLLLSNELNITLMDAIIILLNLNKTPVYLKNSIVYNADRIRNI